MNGRGPPLLTIRTPAPHRTIYLRAPVFCAKRFFNLLRMIFHSVANDFPVDGSLLSGQRQHTNFPPLRTSI